MFTDALRLLGIMGAGESAPTAEDTEVCRRALNRMMGQWNTRKRYAYYIRQQSFEFVNSQASYAIGTAANDADFVVSAGGRPNKIESANLVMTNSDPVVQMPLRIINFDQYDAIQIPALSSEFPNTLYYQPTFPNGTLWFWPAYPSETTFEVNLAWWNQFLTVALGEESVDVPLPDGYEDAIVLSLAERLYPMFPKRSDIAEIKMQAGNARGNIQSLNVPPPVISSTDGIGSRGSGFDWMTRRSV